MSDTLICAKCWKEIIRRTNIQVYCMSCTMNNLEILHDKLRKINADAQRVFIRRLEDERKEADI